MQSISPSFTTAASPSGAVQFAQTLGAGLAACLSIGILAPLPARAGEVNCPQFTEVAASAGLRFHHNFGADKLQNVLMTTGSGCAFLDYDNDGWIDVFMVNSTFLDEHGLPRADKATHHALFHNERNGTFKEVTAAAGITKASYGQGCAVGDYDGDGFVDIYITNYGTNSLYRNRGDGTFEDVTAKSGTGSTGWNSGAVFFDYDGDGDLDLYVSHYLKFRPDQRGVHSSSLSKRSGYTTFPGPRDYEGEDDVMYRNNGDGTFTEVSKEVGLVKNGKGLTVVAADFDNDGDQDLFVANDSTPNFFYENRGGKFVEIALQAGCAYDPQGVETAAMGVDVVDVDGDGNLDIFVTNMIFEFNNMYRNLGHLTFADTTKAMHLDTDNFRHVGWATHFADFNHDGYLDCFVANGHVVDYVEGFSQSITYPQQKMLFLGDSKGRFSLVSKQCGKDFQRKRVSRGGAFGDFDNDGDIDILVQTSGGSAELLRNDMPMNDRWLKIRLKGQRPNTQAIGAKVTTQLGSRKVYSQVSCPASYLSSSDPTIHIGLRPGESEGAVDIVWPSRKTSSHKAKAATLTVIEEPK